MSRPSVWAPKIVALIKGGNSSAAIAQIKVAPTVKDKPHPNVDAATNDMIAELSAPRLHRSP